MAQRPIPSLKSRLSKLDTRIGTPLTDGVSFGDEGRLSAAERGYGAEWLRLRKVILKRDGYLCVMCKASFPPRVTVANQVDHKVPRAEGGTDDHDNLQSLCEPHHAAKSKIENARIRAHRLQNGA